MGLWALLCDDVNLGVSSATDGENFHHVVEESVNESILGAFDRMERQPASSRVRGLPASGLRSSRRRASFSFAWGTRANSPLSMTSRRTITLVMD